MCDAPVTAVVATASNAPARIKTAFLTRHNITTFPCIAADGSKLPLCAVIKGKTERVFKKITNGASAAVRSVRLYESIKRLDDRRDHAPMIQGCGRSIHNGSTRCAALGSLWLSLDQQGSIRSSDDGPATDPSARWLHVYPATT